MKNVLFDNGVTVIAHIRAIENNGRLVITFDPMTANDVNADGYAERFLIKRGYDVISVQKRRDNWFQDLNLDNFIAAVGRVCRSYDEVFAYGSSMGGYAVLYFCSLLNIRILSISPRVSIHPNTPVAIPGFDKRIVTFAHHPLRDVVDHRAEPLIIYDPHDPTDEHYVEVEAKAAFPNAKIVKVQHGGHPVGHALMEMGLLKSFVTSFLEGKEPDWQSVRGNRRKSKTYLSNLGVHLASRKKHRVAIKLMERAISIDPHRSDYFIQKSLSEAAMEQYGEALQSVQRAISLDQKNDAYYVHWSSVLDLADSPLNSLKAANLAISLNDANAMAYVRQSISLFKLAMYDQAIVSARNAVNCDPDNKIYIDHLENMLFAASAKQTALQ
ncbi:tetratricopeptide repeat protein [Sabulicella rubraurantiaca]|uniref:tetratricopeptide repeat protein n=1 Tax=Sabulicella rubraurantiaca TaxID=2811429 RepID=UPI001A95D59A|nr:tetratricopeptide repeat protein [Sabulicella rubraurantiaca]